VGIIEPRKNQGFLLDVAEALWAEGQDFDLHIVGRVNPHFGEPIVRRIEAARARGRPVIYEGAITDEALAKRYRESWACVFPTIAEGCGLPLLEALRCGTPCVASDLPSIRENAAGGGCALLAPNDLAAWKEVVGRLLTDAPERARLESEAAGRSAALPTWSGTARAVEAALALVESAGVRAS
jgi:glycosyltransferase involved in cell wall biosynthesis